MEQSEGLANQQAKWMLDMGWLVGFIEGEGCFALQKAGWAKRSTKFSIVPKVTMSSSDFELIDRASRILGSLGIAYYRYDKETKGKDQAVLLVQGAKRIVRFLSVLVPYMTESRRSRAASVLLTYCKRRSELPKRSRYTEEDFNLWQELRNLNGYQLKQSLRDSTRDVFEYKPKSGTTFNCVICGSEFYRSPAQIRNGATKTCSKKCLGEYFKSKVESAVA